MGKTAFLFPGQGSQSVGMGRDFYEKYEKARAVFASADEVIGQEALSRLIFSGPTEELTKTENAQPAILTVSVAVLRVLEEHGLRPDYVCGHSLGEYSALVAAGALSFTDAISAVRKRGIFMEEAVPNGKGAMAAVLGMDEKTLSQVVTAVTNEREPVQLANLNAPGQIVISGAKEAVKRAGEEAKKNGARRVIPLNVSGPFHSVFMQGAADRFRSVLDDLSISDAAVPVVANVTAQTMTEREEIRTNLYKQLFSPVRWEESIRFLLEAGVDTFIEVGPGNVLTGLVKKIQRRVNAFPVFDEERFNQVLHFLKNERGE